MRSVASLTTTFWIIACGALAAPAHHKAATKPAAVASLPIFSFQGDNTENVLESTSFATTCTLVGDEKTCVEPNSTDIMTKPTLGGVPLQLLMKRYYKSKLESVNGILDAGFFSSLSAASAAKYGPASSTETRKWESKAGGVFDNHIETWNFRGGSLGLESMGSEVDESRFQFVSIANSAPQAPPKVDF